MVVSDRDAATCEIYEIKHSTVADERQLRHLLDSEKLSTTEHRFGTIRKRTVIYRGEDFTHPSGIAYRNAAEYLKSL